MSSKLAFILPVISLVFFLDTIIQKRIKLYFKIPLVIASLAVLILDLFVTLVFYVNCVEMSGRYGNIDCIGWIYPTVDFKIMIILSLLILTAAILGLGRYWRRIIYYFFGALVVFIGVGVRLYILIDASEAIKIAHGTSGPIIFDVFSIVIVYSLISASIYFSIFFLSLFKRNSYQLVKVDKRPKPSK